MTRLLAAEARKLWTVWSTYVVFAIVVVLDAGFGLLIAFAGSGRRGTLGRTPHGSAQWFVNIFAVLSNARLLALVLGILVVTGEYRHKTVTPTFLAEPRRDRVVAAKLGVGFGAGLGLGVVTMLTGLVMGFVLIAAGVHSCLTPHGVQQGMSQAQCSASSGIYYVANAHDMWHDWWQIAPGLVLGTGLFALYGIGVGALLKNQVVAIVAALGFSLVVEGIVGSVLPTVAEYLPSQAATALENAKATVGESGSLLPWWGGAIMVLVYAVGLTVLGVLTTMRSDVT